LSALSKEQIASREKTLLAALLLSLWAPLATGLAVVLSRSTTQLADFIRRSVELIALFISWWVFRYLERKGVLNPQSKARLEKMAGLSVAATMVCSGVILLIVALSRLAYFEPGGNVYPGLAIALLGLATNTWFWRRYTRLTREQYSSIIDNQRQLYRAKAFVDLMVLGALTAVAVNPTHIWTRYIDVIGSLAVVGYLVWSGLRSGRTTLSDRVQP
jgi:divalent metal cation (Fe/Co/Zn/Cd) transporter